MKLTESMLRKIIKEEISKIKEGDVVGLISLTSLLRKLKSVEPMSKFWEMKTDKDGKQTIVLKEVEGDAAEGDEVIFVEQSGPGQVKITNMLDYKPNDVRSFKTPKDLNNIFNYLHQQWEDNLAGWDGDEEEDYL